MWCRMGREATGRGGAGQGSAGGEMRCGLGRSGGSVAVAARSSMSGGGGAAALRRRLHRIDHLTQRLLAFVLVRRLRLDEDLGHLEESRAARTKPGELLRAERDASRSDDAGGMLAPARGASLPRSYGREREDG